MRRLALLALFAAAPLLRPTPVMAAHIAAPLGFTLSCSCADTTGLAYASTLRELLRKDSAYAEASSQRTDVAIDEADPVRIQVTSAPLASNDGIPRIALTVRYTHGDRSIEQHIQTCSRGPLALSAALLVHDFKQLEAEPADPLAPTESGPGEIVTASLRK